MRYGMRERLSGAVILIALAVIFVPMLFDEPAPRSERPQPVMTIEQPVEVERRDVPDPTPPSSLGQIQSPSGSASPDQDNAEAPAAQTEAPEIGSAAAERADAESAETVTEGASETGDASSEDPIAELARAADQRLSSQAEQASRAPAREGEWAVQVGSFAEPGNAERLESNLAAQGLPVYRRARDNGLTTVYVGPYATSRQGEEVMATLKAESNLQGLLVRVDN